MRVNGQFIKNNLKKHNPLLSELDLQASKYYIAQGKKLSMTILHLHVNISKTKLNMQLPFY